MSCWDATKVEPHHNLLRWQALDGDASAYIPHKEPGIKVLVIDAHRPTLAPSPQLLDHTAEFLARAART